MVDEFLIRSALAGAGVVLAAGPLGCFVVWRKLAYFGDSTAHAGILGVALSLAFEISPFIGVLITALVMATLVSILSGKNRSMDTMLGVMAHTALALGLLAVSLLEGVRVDLFAYLFGDILAVTWGDVSIIWGGALLVLALLIWRWPSLLTATLNPDLAHAGGIDPKREQLVLTITLAIVVAVAMKVVGALLIAAMLIIPATAARSIATTPERMAVFATLIGVVSVGLGLYGSLVWDTPTGPSIVSAAAFLFGGVLIGTRLRALA